MAEVTITRLRSFVAGNRKKIVALVDIAADGDTLTVGNIMHRIEGIAITLANSTNPVGATTSQGASAALTFSTQGAETNVHVELTGQ